MMLALHYPPLNGIIYFNNKNINYIETYPDSSLILVHLNDGDNQRFQYENRADFNEAVQMIKNCFQRGTN